ncbi:MAG TPA: hypothetical protein VFQ35_12010, partial [Polyangiaceae bacterium]|nr:hypothetical protein [Polyangiaceae bacterium]
MTQAVVTRGARLLWATMALLALACSSETATSSHFDPRGEVFVSPRFTLEQCEVVESALAAWSNATNGDVAFQVRIGEGYPRIVPAEVGERIMGEFVPSERPEIVLDTQKALDATALRNLTLHELGHAIGLPHIPE